MLFKIIFLKFLFEINLYVSNLIHSRGVIEKQVEIFRLFLSQRLIKIF